MTTYLPEGLSTAGTGQLFVAPAVADVNAPTLAEFGGTDGFVLGCNVYGWAPTKEQAKTTENRYCLAEGIESFGRVSNQIEAIEVVYDPQNPEDPNYAAYLKLVTGAVQYIYDRRGKDSELPLAVDNVGDLYKVRIGARSRVPITNEDGETHRTRIELAIIEPPIYDVKIAA